MGKKPISPLKLMEHCRSSRAVVAVALFLAMSLSARPAAASQYFYSGRDASSPNIVMELHITQTAAGNDVTGTVRCGNVVMYVKGVLAGNHLNANIRNQPSAGTVFATAASGMLNGTLGTGVLNVTTGPVNINGHALTLTFVLVPPAPAAGAPVGVISASGTGSPPHPMPPALPGAVHLVGGTGFGYTQVTLDLNLALTGSSYQVNGTIVVNQLVLVRFSPSRNVQTTLRVSGMLTPGTTGALRVIGAPNGNSPLFSGTLGLSGSPFQGFLSGIPSLGITGLVIGAQK